MFRMMAYGCCIAMLSLLAWSNAAALTDAQIKENLVDALVFDVRVDASDIIVEVSDGDVVLRGAVPSYLASTAAHEVAFETVGVTSVDNNLVVVYQPPFTPPTDPQLRAEILSKLSSSPDIDVLDKEVEVNAGIVTLRGTVDAYWKKLHAEDLAAAEAGVIDVKNHLAVVPTEDFVDEVIAENIINSMELRYAVSADDITVSVEDGEVTLTGVVSDWNAKDAAYRAALFTTGVLEVEDLITVIPDSA